MDGSQINDHNLAPWPEMDARLDRAALGVAAKARQALEPDPPFDLYQWTCAHRVFDDASAEPGPFDPDVAPYLNDVLRLMSPVSGIEEHSLIKCAQSGGSVVLESFMAAAPLYVPGPAMLVHPTVKAFKDWAEEKWWPMVQATKVLDPDRGGAVMDRNDKKTGGSTSDRIRFINGAWIAGAGANSAATLRQKSIRYMGADDLDGFTEDADNEGDPEKLAHQRTKTYRRKAMAITVRVSTPLLEGGSRIKRHYDRSTKNRFYHGCLDCGAATDFDWEDVEKAEHAPFKCHVVCPSCGSVHTHGQKREMQRRGVWIPTAHVPGQSEDDVPPKTIEPDDIARWRDRDMGPLARHQGWWITGFMNFAETWNSIAQQESELGDDPKARQVFDNTVLGRTHKLETKTPDWDALSARRSMDFDKGEGVTGPLVFVLSADVQSYGIYWLIKGYDREERMFYLDWGLIPGDTADSHPPADAAARAEWRSAWKGFTEVFERGAPLPGGARFAFDAVMIDAKYNTTAVKDWVRRRPHCHAINGDPGWNRDVIWRAEQTDLKRSGKRSRFGVQIWHIGTWSVKRILTTRYARTATGDGFTEFGPPTGYCWLPRGADEPFLRQLTSEYVQTTIRKTDGRKVQQWNVKTGEENHLFDCDVYNFAGFHLIGARAGSRGSWSDEDWQDRTALVARTIDQDGTAQSDLFDARAGLARKITGETPAERRSADGTAPLTALQRLGRLNKG